MADQLLENVFIEVDQEDEEFEVLTRIPIASLPYNTTASSYIILRLPEEVSMLSTSLTNTLKFVVKDADAGPSDPGLTDEYPVRIKDYYCPLIPKPTTFHSQLHYKLVFEFTWHR